MEKLLNGLQESIVLNCEKVDCEKVDCEKVDCEKVDYENNINVEDHYGLVRNISSYYYKNIKLKSLTYNDLFQIGFMGLYEAKKRYNPNRNVKFSTYARYWIIAYILKDIKNLDGFQRYDKRRETLNFQLYKDIFYMKKEEEQKEIINIEDILSILKEHEKELIYKIYFKRITLSILSKEYNITKEGIRQRKITILRKLKKYHVKKPIS